MIELENDCFVNLSIIIDSGKDYPWMLKSLDERLLVIGYSQSLKISLHNYLTDCKGRNVHLKWRDLAVTALSK